MTKKTGLQLAGFGRPLQAHVLHRLKFCVLYISLHQVGFVKLWSNWGIGSSVAREQAQLACWTVEKHSFRVYGYGPVEFFI